MDEPPHHTPAATERKRMEWEILERLLLKSDETPWRPIMEVVRETANPITALDALAALSDAGLIRRRGRYVTLTRAAQRFYQLITWP